MCTFRASCCSARVSRAQIPVPLSGTGKKGEGVMGGGGGGGRLHWRVPESVAGGGWF